MTFGGATSRIISDQSDQDDAQGRATPNTSAAALGGGGDAGSAPVPNPTTPRTPGYRPVRRLTTTSPKNDAASEAKTASVKPLVTPSKEVDAGEEPPNYQPKMSKKFAELKAKNDAKKAEKAKQYQEMKAKYGNKFNELKAKNEERARQKEAAKAKAAAAATSKSSQPVEDDSSGCEWF